MRVTVTWLDGKRETEFGVTTHIVNIPGAEVGIGTTQVLGGQPGMPGGMPGQLPGGGAPHLPGVNRGTGAFPIPGPLPGAGK